MKTSEKLKKVKELQKKIKNIDNKSHRKLMEDRDPLQREVQKLKDSILNEKIGLAGEIKKDVNKFVKQMKKKYGKLKDLDITCHVLYFGTNAEIAVDFEVPLESLIRRKEELEKEKPKKKAKRKKSLKGEKAIVGGPRSIGHVMANMQKWDELETEKKNNKLKAKGKK